jgi:hypothetical protein
MFISLRSKGHIKFDGILNNEKEGDLIHFSRLNYTELQTNVNAIPTSNSWQNSMQECDKLQSGRINKSEVSKKKLGWSVRIEQVVKDKVNISLYRRPMRL